jgi:adenine-specific DNA-methyltransferase
VDDFHLNTGEVRSDGADGVACWFMDIDYNGESFFGRVDAWATLKCDTSRPFGRPKSGRIAVKVINHLGDEVMNVFKVA